MLVSRSALNYIEFMKIHFSRDVMIDDGLFIMPLGFKLPFKPEDFLSKNAADYSSTKESKDFILSIVNVIQSLKDEGIEDSIVLGFDLYFENVKKSTNSDILAAITEAEKADVTFSKKTNIQISDDPNAPIYNVNDAQFQELWKYNHKELVNWCRENIPGFKTTKQFNSLKKDMKNNNTHKEYVITRRLDYKNPNSASKDFYTEKALEYIKNNYK